jgi:acetyltransferase, GNAT family
VEHANTDRIPSQRRVVFDTNVLIALHDYHEGESDKGQAASELAEILERFDCHIYVGDGTLDDFARAGSRSLMRERDIARYPQLAAEVAPDLASRCGYPDREFSANTQSDLRLLALLDEGKAKWLISDDKALLGHAACLGKGKALSVDEALNFLRPAVDTSPSSPAVRKVSPAEVNLGSPFFQSLFSSYPDFRSWWKTKVVAQKRLTLILGSPQDPIGITVIKEADPDYGLPADTAKICTFKIDEESQGNKSWGELLLKEVIKELRAIPASCTFLEIDADKISFMVKWLESFGFYRLHGVQAANGDTVMVKDLFPARTAPNLEPWDFHKRYGPGAVCLDTGRAFLVPIQPQWHDRLFPDPHTPTLSESMFAERCGNTIKKIYICKSPIKTLCPGDLLIFVESETGGQVRNLGVVEDTLRSDDPLEILQFASTRTVYSENEITSFTSVGREVLVIKFRHDRQLSPPWTHAMAGYDTLVDSSPAQSIERVKEEGVRWLRKQRNVWS